MTYRILCIFILILDIEKGFDIPENKFKDLLLMMMRIRILEAIQATKIVQNIL